MFCPGIFAFYRIKSRSRKILKASLHLPYFLRYIFLKLRISKNFQSINFAEIPDDLVAQLGQLNGDVAELKLWKDDVDVSTNLCKPLVTLY